ncbi:hypothetical protein ACIBED_14895 [Rhodococcus coprophilus]|uniref:hypothetical protein n=1 Tax=Rhodococcus coprophilus TaxID=38310 RepID=UPI0020FFF623|nr:hypothetical protein [Rhodococcus coprophilus]
MSDDESSGTSADNAAEQPASPSPSRARIDRARLARIFGDVLPETTRDERDSGGEGRGDSDEWLRRQVPPHHGGV